jgi:hypothetical protein
MSEQITISIKPHLSNYLQDVWSFDISEPIKLSTKKFVGHYLFSLLEEAPVKHKEKQLYKVPLTLIFPDRDAHGKLYDARYKKLIISEINQERFNDTIEEMMKQNFDSYMYGTIESERNEMYTGIVKFFTKFKLTDGQMTFEAFKKRFYRKRKKAECLY